jgi:putative protein kinase ArgK-like GTPase of G3E family
MCLTKIHQQTEPAPCAGALQGDLLTSPVPAGLFRYQGWTPQVLGVSAHTGKGVPALARLVRDFQEALRASGEMDE